MQPELKPKELLYHLLLVAIFAIPLGTLYTNSNDLFQTMTVLLFPLGIFGFLMLAVHMRQFHLLPKKIGTVIRVSTVVIIFGIPQSYENSFKVVLVISTFTLIYLAISAVATFQRLKAAS